MSSGKIKSKGGKSLNSDLCDTVAFIHTNMNYYGERPPVSMSMNAREIRLSVPNGRSIGVSVVRGGDNRIHRDEDGFYLAVAPNNVKNYVGIKDEILKALKRR